MGKGLLIIVLGFSTIFSGMMFNITANQQLASKAIVDQYEKWLIRNATESATNVALSQLYRDFDWRTGYSNMSFADATYDVSVTDITADSTVEAKKVMVKAISTYADEIDSTVAVTMQPAYSYYYYWVENWPSFLTYDNGDTIPGPLHANDQIRISNSPVFLDVVSSDMSSYLGVLTPNPKFYGGLDFGTSTIAAPDVLPLIDSTNAGGHVFNDEVWLTFKSDGSYDYETLGGSIGNQMISSLNGTIMTTSSHDIHIKGVVNGKVTVLSDNDLLIEDHLVYDTHPLVDSNSDDLLGLIARDDVVVPDSGIVDIQIHAAIIALDEFITENYDSGLPRGTMTILGSLVLANDNESGVFSGSVLEHGHNRIHLYDPRLRSQTSPFFPRVDRVELLFRGN